MNMKNRILIILNALLNRCPSCYSTRLKKVKQFHLSGHEDKRCLDCQYTWKESDFIFKKTSIEDSIMLNGMIDEASELKMMSEEAYKDFIAENFEIRSNLN
jgi:hypothetical protein